MTDTATKDAPAAAKKAAAAPPKTTKPQPLGASLATSTSYASILLWGPEGTGKTTDALRLTSECTGDQKLLVVNAEAGVKKAALVQRGVDPDRVELWPPSGNADNIHYESMEDLVVQLREAGPDRYVGWSWDSGTEITRRILDSVTATARMKDAAKGKNRERFQVNLEDHGVASSMLRDLLRKFRDLPMHGIITALERRDIGQDTGRVKYGPNMSPAMANDTAGLVDIVGYCVVEELGDHLIRSAHFVPTVLRRAKDRYGLLPPKMADPYADRILQYMSGEITKDTDPVQARVRKTAESIATGGEGNDDEKKENG